MTVGHAPPSGLQCPRCPGKLRTWARDGLLVEFCDQCSALFLDRGELFEFFRAEGYECPPEALLRFDFSITSGEQLQCPKCRKTTLMPGTAQGAEMWHCTPCNGFLVDRGLLLGDDKARNVPLHAQGFELWESEGSDGRGGVLGTVARALHRLAGRGKRLRPEP